MDRKSFILRCMTEKASFCEPYNRNSCILWELKQKQLLPVTGKPETAIFCELCDINSFIL
jgi:hypothetical protein